MAIKYDEIIEAKKKEIERLEKQIPELTGRRNNLVKEINQTINDAKAKAEKTIADAIAKAEGIVAAADKVKADAEVMKGEAVKINADLSEREKVFTEACRVEKAKEDKLAQDKIDFGKEQADKQARTDAIIARMRELAEAAISFGKTVNAKVAEVIKL